METTVKKTCSKCGKDVSQIKRVKDTTGRYHCHECWTHVTSRQAKPSAEPAAAPTRLPPLPPIASTRSDAANTPLPEPHAGQPKIGGSHGRFCSNCGLETGALQQMWDWKGHPVCLSCHDTLQIEESRRVAANHLEAQQKSAQAVEQAGQALISTDKRRKTLSGLIYMFLFLPFAIFAECGSLVGASEKKDSDAYIAVIVFGCAIPFGLVGIFVQLRRYRAATTGLSASVLREDLAALSGTMLKWLAVIAAVIAGVVAIVWGAAWLIGGWGILVGLVVAFVILYGMASATDQSKCPRCNRWFVAVTDRSDHVGQSQHLVTKMKAVNITSKYAQGDRVVGQMDVPVQQTMVTDAFQLYRHCKRCGYHWTATAKQVTKA